MVVFTCNHCGDSVKKNKVDTHVIRCSRQISVSCMDCNKDFDGRTYAAHTQCISEQEKYSPKGFVAKPASNKGQEKQQAWLTMINNVIASSRNLPAEDRKLLQIISNYSNIPRKKKKFENFLKNGLFFGSQECVDRVWGMLQQKFTECQNNDKADVNTIKNSEVKVEESENVPPQVNAQQGEEGDTKLTKKQRKALKKAKLQAIAVEVNVKPEAMDVASEELDNPQSKKPKKGKKRKAGAEENSQNGIEIHNGDASPSPNKKSKEDNGVGFVVNTVENTPTNGTPKTKKKKKKKNANVSVNNDSSSSNKESEPKFDWQDAVVKTLASIDDKRLSVKHLRRKILRKYESETGRPITESLKAKFAKRLNSVSVVKTVKGIAMLSPTA